MSNAEDLKKLIANSHRRLQKLKERETLEGLAVSPEVLIEIEDIEAKLEAQQADLAALPPEGLINTAAILRQMGLRMEKSEQSVRSIPFWDRDQHINKIKDNLGPPYYLLDAPAGYGKTELLMELKRRACQEGWLCAYVCADDYETSLELIKGLAWELELQQPLIGLDPRYVGLSFGGLLKQERRSDITRKGLLLLIDLGRQASLDLMRDLVTGFIPGVQNSLQVDRFFQHEHNPFRVVLAGRHLAKEKSKIEAPPSVPLTVEQLSPFTYRDLLDTTRQYLSETTSDSVITQIAAEIMHITGGHPGCMASLLRLYRKTGELPPHDFFDLHKAHIKQVINRGIDEVYNGIHKELQTVIDILGSFRQVNLHILSFLLDQKHLEGYNNGPELADKLRICYYFRTAGPLLCNDNHRLLGLRHRGDNKHAKIAQKSCEFYLGIPSARRPETWAIEYLYQFLQGISAEQIKTPAKRKKVQRTLLQTEVPHILNKLVAHKDDYEKKNRYQTLLQLLDEDDEFRFAVNYYTGRNQYNDEPYKQLVMAVNQFFKPEEVGG